MGLLKLLLIYAYIAVLVMPSVLKSAESTVLIHFDELPQARSRFSTAVFRYSVEGPDRTNACKNNGCSIYCELDGQTLTPCPADIIILKNLTENQEHNFRLNITTRNGERSSSAYSWFIDTIPPTATIFSKDTYTSADRITLDVTFSEACGGEGGFKCLNSTSCDVIVTGPAHVDSSSMRIIKHGLKYSLDVIISATGTYGRLVIRTADKFCKDQAGNSFRRANSSLMIIHFDRRPLTADLWTSVPSYELSINGVPRTVSATNGKDNIEIFLDFSSATVNSTKEILNALHVNSGILVPIHSKSQGNRRFAFSLEKISRTEIVTVEVEAALIIGRSGTPVSPVNPITFLYDSMKPAVALSTSSPRVTKEADIKVIVEFTKPVFGFEASMVEIRGGRLARFNELSRALYSLTVEATSAEVVSVVVPARKTNDVSGNPNLASNRLEVKHYTVPAISIALHTFITAGILATSLAAAVLSVSSANLAAIAAASTGAGILIVNPSMNVHGMLGHLQVFVLMDWISVSLPIEYSETTKGLRWLIPREKVIWRKESYSVWPTHFYLEKKPVIKSNFSSSSSIGLPVPGFIDPKIGWVGHGNISTSSPSYGLPLGSSEYFTYFLRGEPLSASSVVKRMENYKGWQDLEMNLFWLGLGGGSLFTIHILTINFLRWRTGKSAQGTLSVPRFELLLIILALPCICQASAFVLRGGTTAGIITGALLLALPAALIFSICLFLLVAIFTGSLAQYKEIKHVDKNEPWYVKLRVFFVGRPTTGKWYYREGLPSSFLMRFGILFENRKGPPLSVFVDQRDPNSIPKWTESGQSGIGRMRAISSEESNEENKATMIKRLLGCARSSYIIIDLVRRVCLGILSGASSSPQTSQALFALVITMVQFLYLFILKPYISRGVQVVETVSLLCEAGIFGMSICINGSNPDKERIMGFTMLSLLFLAFVSQLVNEWYNLIQCVLRLSRPQENSCKLGLKCVAKGLILPFLPKKNWSRVIPGSIQSKTGLVPVVPPSSESEFERTDVRIPHVDPLSAMTATVVPMASPGSSVVNDKETLDIATRGTALGKQRTGEGKRLKGPKLESKTELLKLRELAMASFSRHSRGDEGSTSYAPTEHPFSGEGSSEK